MRLSTTILLATSVATLVATFMVASCGGGSDGAADFDVVQPFVTTVREGVAGIDDAGTIACASERRAVEVAVEAFELLEGRPPVDEDDLVPDWLREHSILFDVTDGQIVPAADSPCG